MTDNNNTNNNKSRQSYGCLFFVSVVCCPGKVSATGRPSASGVLTSACHWGW